MEAYSASPVSLAGFKGATSKGKEREGSTQPGPTFSLVCATPLLQHQAQLGLKPAPGGGVLTDTAGRCRSSSGLSILAELYTA